MYYGTCGSGEYINTGLNTYASIVKRTLNKVMGPLHHPAPWYGINYAGTHSGTFKTKESRIGLVFVLEESHCVTCVPA